MGPPSLEVYKGMMSCRLGQGFSPPVGSRFVWTVLEDGFFASLLLLSGPPRIADSVVLASAFCTNQWAGKTQGRKELQSCQTWVQILTLSLTGMISDKLL
jgi:hypothetical protein